MQREYEVMFLVKPTLEDSRYQEIIEKFKAVITNNGGDVVSINPWGLRDLAQEFNKITRAYYVVSRFNTPPASLKELRQFFMVTEDIMRDLVVLVDSIELKGGLAARAKQKVATES
jgi:small subunit ribosomal protein S6